MSKVSQSQPDRLQVETIEELLERAELLEFEMFEVQGRRYGPEGPPPDVGTFSVQIAPKLNQRFIAARFRLEFRGPNSLLVADIASHYGMTEPTTFSPNVFVDFIERVAFMATYPFLRESIYVTAARLRDVVPTLGLMRAGAFNLDLPSASQESVIAEAWDDGLEVVVNRVSGDVALRNETLVERSS